MAGSYIRGSHGRFAGSTGGWGARGGGGGSRTGLGGRVTRLRGGGTGRTYVGRSRVTTVSKINRSGRVSAPSKLVGVHLRARRYPLTKFAIGSPIRGNRDVRYVSRTNQVLSFTGSPAGRAAGRLVSRHGSRGGAPRSGYIVARAPRAA